MSLDGERRGRGWWSRHGLKLLFSAVIAAVLIWGLHQARLPLVPSAEAMSGVKWWTLPVYAFTWSAVHVVRGARWHFLLAPIERVPLGKVLSVAFIGFAAIIIMPFRTGEVVRPVLIRQKQGKLSGWAAAGTIGAERVIDGLVLSVMLFVALSLATPVEPTVTESPPTISVGWVPGAAYGALAVFASAFVVMGVFYWRRAWARRIVSAVIGKVSPRAAEWLSERVEKVASGIGFLPRLRYTVPFLLATTAYWLGNAATLWLLAWGTGFETMTMAQACVVVGVVALGILVPNAPGFIGAYQLSVYVGLLTYFPEPQVVSAGSALVFIVYLTQMGITLLAAGGALAIGRPSIRGAFLRAETEPT